MAEPTERIAILLELQQQEFEKRAKKAGAAIDRLERKFNPLAAAEAKLTKEQLRFNAALEAGTIDATQHAKGMDLVQREYDQTVAKSKLLTSSVLSMNSSLRSQGNFLNRNKETFRQAGYQVGDFAVQVQGGQSALTAFTQQGSQLLGVFGPMGAVLGAVLAVGAPLAGYFLSTGDAAASLDDKLKDLRDSIEAVRAVESLSGMDMAAEFGSLADEAKAIYEINKQIAEIRASAALDAAARGIAGELGVSDVFGFTPDEVRELEQTIAEVQARMRELNDPSNMTDIEFAKANMELEQLNDELDRLKTVSRNMDDLADSLGLTENEARDVVAQFAAIGQADGPSQQAQAMADLSSYINEATGNLEDASDEGKEFYDQLLEATLQALNLAKVDVAANVGAGADEAARLAENLGISLETAARLAKLGPQGAPPPQGGRADPRPMGGSFDDWRYRDADAFNENWTPPKPNMRGGSGRSGGGRSGGSKAEEPLVSISEGELDRLRLQIDMLGKSKAEVAALTVKHKLLDEAKKRGIAITAELTEQIDAEAAEVGALAEQYDLARDKIAAMEKIQGQWKDSVIDAAMGGADAMDSFRDAIKRAALEYALFGTGMFAGSGGGGSSSGGLLGGFLSGIFGGIGANANGTPNWRGGLTSVNERGGEIMNLPQGTQIIPHDLSKRMIDKSGGGVTEIIIRNEPGTMVEIARNEAGAIVRQASSGIVRQSVGQAQASFRNSKQEWSPR